jgi:hypothetical protein
MELSSRLGAPDVLTLQESLELDLAGRQVVQGSPLFPRADLLGG